MLSRRTITVVSLMARSEERRVAPAKLVNFSESGLEHVQFVHNFCSSYIFYAIKFWDLIISINNQQILEEVVSLVRLVGAVDGIISIKTHLKGSLGFNGILDLAFLFIEETLQ